MAAAGYGISDGAGGFVTKLEGDGDAKIGNSAEDVIQITGSLKVAGGAVFNEGSIDADFRIESNNNENMFFIDGSSNRMGLGTASPQVTLDIQERAGVESVLRLMGTTDVGIRIAADTDNAGEGDNPYIDFYQDGLNSNSRDNRLASMAMEGNAGTSFTDSLANAFFLNAHCPNSAGARPFQIATDQTDGTNKARITVEGSNGYVGINTTTPSHTLEVDGDFKATEEVVFGTTSTDLGSGTTSTLTPASSIHLLTATSITAGGEGMHIMSLASGTATGQILKVIMNTTTNNQPIMVSPTNVLGSYNAIAIENDKTGAAFEFIWNGSKWILMSNNALASVS